MNMDIVNPSIETPLYQQIYEILFAKINSGEFRTGDRIPSEDELCSIYNVSRVTVRNSIKRLVEEGALVKKQGKGTFVASPVVVESTSAQGSFTRSCLQMGWTPSTRLISRKMLIPGAEIAKVLELSEDQRVICIKRARIANGIPVIFEVDYFKDTYKFPMENDMEQTPILELLRNEGLMRGKHGYIDTIDVRFATKEQSDWLDCNTGTPLLGVRQVVFGIPHAVLYYNEQYIKSEVYKYVIQN